MEGTDSEDIVVVIVGDEEEDYSQNQHVLNIKQEVLDNGEMAVEELIETAEKYGEPIEIEYLKKEPEDDYEVECIDSIDDDADYLQDFSDEDSDEGVRRVMKKKRFNPTIANNREQQRHKMLAPEEQRSFVHELRGDHPELAEDTELLIDTLARIMLDIKRPDPPRDYFIMNNIMFECVVCGATTESMPAASRHWQEKHGPRYLICFACGVDFRSTTNLYKHEKRCTASDAEIVLKARARTLGLKGRGRPFLVTSDSLRKLKKQTQAKKRFPCSYCSADFSSKQSAQSHEHKHTGARPYRCDLCPAAYTSACGLSRHSAKHTDIQFICDHCQRPFKNKSALVVHLDTHKPLRKYPCEECGRRFAQKMALQLHVDREHRNLPPPCACQICPKRYPRMSLLKNHMRKEHGMTLITRKMFYKSLPLLSETQLQQAKVVMKSDLEKPVAEEPRTDNYPRHPTFLLDKLEEGPTGNLTYELKLYMKNLQKGQADDSKYIVIQNGEAICLDGSNIDFYKNKLISEVEHELDRQLEYSVIEVQEDSKADILKQIYEIIKQNESEKIPEELHVKEENSEENSDELVLCETSGVILGKPSEDTNKNLEVPLGTKPLGNFRNKALSCASKFSS